MMDKLRKRILLDLFASPMTVIPTTLGTSLLFVSVILGGNTAFYGIMSLLIGVGALLTNFVFNLDKISQNASIKWLEELQLKKDQDLNALDEKLVQSSDPRDERVFRNLRTVYKEFCDDLKDKEINNIPIDMLSTIDELFQSCIQKIEQSLDMHDMAKNVTGKIRKQIASNRDAILEDVEQSILELSETILEVRALRIRTESVDLDQLRERMKNQLQVAKATEEQMGTLNHTNEMNRFREYEELAE
jgi:hypothetical protein